MYDTTTYIDKFKKKAFEKLSDEQLMEFYLKTNDEVNDNNLNGQMDSYENELLIRDMVLIKMIIINRGGSL